MTQPTFHYSPLRKLLHWAGVVLIGGALLSILLREGVEDTALRAGLLQGHILGGVFLLLLWPGRVLLRMREGMAPPPRSASAKQAHAAHWVHTALYGAMALQPLLGWAYQSARGKAVILPGVGTLPALCAKNSLLSDIFGVMHEGVGWGFAALIGLHVAAALYHSVVCRDGVVQRMLPRALAKV